MTDTPDPRPTDFPLVTIGIPTYNRADGYLRSTLDSALAQSYPNLEIIISDNASTDGTEAYIRGLDDPRIRYIRQPENIGANNNYNACLAPASGRYFQLLHDDDVIDADFIESCVRAAGGRTVGVIRSGVRLIDADGNTTRETRNRTAGLDTAELFLAWFEQKTAFYLASTLYNTEALKDIGGFGTRQDLFQDVAAIVQLDAALGRADVEEVKASFRRHDSNKGGLTTVFDWVDDSLFLLDLICATLPDRADALRPRGQAFLCRKCYSYVAALPTPLERWRTYRQLDRMFDHRYPPLTYLVERETRRVKQALRRLIGDGERQERDRRVAT